MANTNISDEELVKKITDGDKELYREVVERYQAKLLRYVLSILNGNEAAAQDVTQEVFLKSYVKLNSFNQKKKFSSWIYRIAHNETINYLKKHKKELYPDDDAWIGQIPDYRDGTDKILTRAYKQEEVKKAVNSLDLKYKEPLMLFAFEGLSYEQIAETLSMPKSTVGVRITRAKGKLKDLLEESLK